MRRFIWSKPWERPAFAIHLPSAINLPPHATEQLASTLLPDKNVDIVLYCLDLKCVAPLDAARTLKQMGYINLYEYEGANKTEWKQVTDRRGKP